MLEGAVEKTMSSALMIMFESWGGGEMLCRGRPFFRQGGQSPITNYGVVAKTLISEYGLVSVEQTVNLNS